MLTEELLRTLKNMPKKAEIVFFEHKNGWHDVDGAVLYADQNGRNKTVVLFSDGDSDEREIQKQQ